MPLSKYGLLNLSNRQLQNSLIKISFFPDLLPYTTLVVTFSFNR